MIMQRSTSGTDREAGTWASASTSISLLFIRDILLFRMASAMVLPVFKTVSMVRMD